MLDEEKDFQFIASVKLLLFAGFRRGELCGLEWSDIDFTNQVIHVRRSSLYLPEKGIFTDDTKNVSSERSIKVSYTAIEVLEWLQRQQTEYRLSLGDQWVECNRLFTAWNGTPINPDVLSNKFQRFVSRHNLPSISVHSLRHTNATLQIAGGVNIVTVAKRFATQTQTPPPKYTPTLFNPPTRPQLKH